MLPEQQALKELLVLQVLVQQEPLELQVQQELTGLPELKVLRVQLVQEQQGQPVQLALLVLQE